ncbi:MFS transporter [Streptomyces sp. NBC_01294]|uniref:MFS transporter n=1 Tax=Streptomyces sp. NBC_01294 TaxID=2903815 RepID=UPI002DDB99DE|nr:MFS transporter [Streptomyces sp. NBC_01294]WRZ60575.1 MFS transporter [Streptomyces sp. NBC_01294]
MSSPFAAPPGSPARRRRPAWAGRNYTLLTGAAVVTNLGSHGALIAAAFAVLEAGGSGGDVGLVAAARTLPLVLFLLVGGAMADRLPRHHVMVAANALNCVSQAAFAVLVLAGDPQLWQMMLLTALCGTGTAFFNPAAEGMLLSTVSGEHANRAFALFRMAMNGAGIGGAALGGAMIAAMGPGWVLAVDAAAFAIAGALRAFLDVSHVTDRAPGGGLLADLREGWVEVRTRPWLWSIVLQFSVVVAVVGAADAVYGPLVARDRLGGPAPWGLALAFFGVGTIAGAFLMMAWKPRRLLLVGTLCVFPLALPSAGLAVPLPVWGLCVVMFVSGAAIEVFGVNWMTTMHQEIPEEKFSRVSAYDWFGSVSMLPLATALAGPAESAFGRTTALWGCAALVVLVTALVLLVPDVRRMTRAPHTKTTTPTFPSPTPSSPTSPTNSSPAGV